MTFTVPSEACQAQFNWTGVQAGFPCGFPALSASNLVIQYASNAVPPATFTGQINGSVLTASGPFTGAALGIGSVINGVGVAAGTKIIGLGSGVGGAGTYVLNNSQIIAPEAMTAATPIVLALGVHYTATLDALTGNVTINPIAMPDNGPGVVTVTRNTPATQGTQYQNLETYQADSLTNNFDAAMMAIAELKRRASTLEAAAFGPNFVVPTVVSGPRLQRAIVAAGNLPITQSDSILNINSAGDLAPVVPAASTRNGTPITFKNIVGSHAQTLLRTGTDTFDGEVTLVVMPGEEITLTPFNDTVNNALGYLVG